MIRRARSEEAAAVAALFRRSFGTLTFLPTLHTPAEDLEHFERLFAEHELWVYELAGRLVGIASLDGNELSNLNVEPDVIVGGIGSALLDHAKARRPGGLGFWVFQENARARRFYERRGCVLVELTDGSGNEERKPDARYEWTPG